MITRENYEEYFLLYVDNELSAAERKLVEDWVGRNPDLREEWEGFLSTRLGGIGEERPVFLNKESLYRFAEPGAGDSEAGIGAGALAGGVSGDAGGLITKDNYSEYFLSFIDGELSPADRSAVEAFIRQHPSTLAGLEQLRATISQPDKSVVFPDKAALYRSEKKRRMFYIPRVAAAAALLGVAAILVLMNRHAGPGASSVALGHSGQNATSTRPVNQNGPSATDLRTGQDTPSVAALHAGQDTPSVAALHAGQGKPSVAAARPANQNDPSVAADHGYGPARPTRDSNAATAAAQSNATAATSTTGAQHSGPADHPTGQDAQSSQKLASSSKKGVTNPATTPLQYQKGSLKTPPEAGTTLAVAAKTSSGAGKMAAGAGNTTGRPDETDGPDQPNGIAQTQLASRAGNTSSSNIAVLAVAGHPATISKEQSSFATQELLKEEGDENDNLAASYKTSNGKSKLRGFFRKVTRTFSKTADRDKDGQREVLVGAFQVSL